MGLSTRSPKGGEHGGYGWVPDLPDHRDFLFAPDPKALRALATTPHLDLSTDKAMPTTVWDQGQLGSCFPAGTRVRMADGTERPIEDVRLLDRVLTAEGNLGEVARVMVRFEEEEIVALKLWGHGHLRCTAEHPILTRRGYVAAAEVLLDDFVAMPRYLGVGAQEIQVGELLSKVERTLKTGVRKFGVLHGRADIAVRVAALPETISLTAAFGRLAGLFLAEGSTSSGKARWTFGAHEEETLVAETVGLLRDCLGCEPYVQHRPNNSINVVLYGTAWARFWERLCGNGSGNKRPHALLLGAPREVQEAMLFGWLAGDGWKGKRAGRVVRTCGVSVSHDLALAMFDIAQALGLRPTINLGKPILNKHVASRRPRWTVEINDRKPRAGTGGDNWRVEQEDGVVWRKVRAVERAEFAGHVYNLSVTGDESYVAEGVGVHNCTAHSVGAAFAFAHKKAGHRAMMPSRLWIYYQERLIEGTVDQDAGAMIRDGFKAVAAVGVPPESYWPYDIATFEGPPSSRAGKDAVRHKALVYRSVPQDLNSIKAALLGGYPVSFGFTVYESFESAEVASSGIVPMPTVGERVLGGHAVLAVGYDDPSQMVIVRNSWGPDWGKAGYFMLPYAFITSASLASDFWQMTLAA